MTNKPTFSDFLDAEASEVCKEFSDGWGVHEKLSKLKAEREEKANSTSKLYENLAARDQDVKRLDKEIEALESWLASGADNNQKNSRDNDPYGWKKNAQAIADDLRQNSPELSKKQVCEKVHKQMVARHGAGEAGMTGRGGKIPSASTIESRDGINW